MTSRAPVSIASAGHPHDAPTPPQQSFLLFGITQLDFTAPRAGAVPEPAQVSRSGERDPAPDFCSHPPTDDFASCRRPLSGASRWPGVTTLAIPDDRFHRPAGGGRARGHAYAPSFLLAVPDLSASATNIGLCHLPRWSAPNRRRRALRRRHWSPARGTSGSISRYSIGRLNGGRGGAAIQLASNMIPHRHMWRPPLRTPQRLRVVKRGFTPRGRDGAGLNVRGNPSFASDGRWQRERCEGLTLPRCPPPRCGGGPPPHVSPQG